MNDRITNYFLVLALSVLSSLCTAVPSPAALPPKVITTIEELQKIGNDPKYPLNGRYILGCDIDASRTFIHKNGINSTTGFSPIGKSSDPFTGTFDGNGRTIRGLHINGQRGDSVGLFGVLGIGAVIKNLGIENARIQGQRNTGALAGWNNGGIITHCYCADTTISGRYFVGGLIGSNSGSILNCYSTAIVNGSSQVGGLAGFNNHGTVINCYSSSSVRGNDDVGGLVGYNDGEIKQSYSLAEVRGINQAGGFLGRNLSEKPINNCYSTGPVNGINNTGGFIGWNHSVGMLLNCFWDIQSSQQPVGVGTGSSLGVSGKTTALMLKHATFTSMGSPVWDFKNTWFMIDGQTRPFLRVEHSTIIRNSHHLQLMAINPDASYVLESIIDLSTSFKNKHDMWGTARGTTGSGFSPIGSLNAPFTGVFNGGTHSLLNLFIDRPNSDNIGFFGVLTGQVINLGIEDCAITGRSSTGALAGRCTASNISNCYTTGDVKGTAPVGGLIGNADKKNMVTNCFSAITVQSKLPAGGLFGSSKNNTVAGCFWERQTSGCSFGTADGDVPGAESKTAEEMKNSNTYVNASWDFSSVWGIAEGLTYPFFIHSADTPAAVTAIVKANVSTVDSIGPHNAFITESGSSWDSQAPLSAGITLQGENKVYDSSEKRVGTSADRVTYDPRFITTTTAAAIKASAIDLPVASPYDHITAKTYGAITSDNDTLSVADNTTLAGSRADEDIACPVEAIYGKNSPEVTALRSYRDTILMKSTQGKAVIALYYRLAPTLIRAFRRDEAFKEKVNGMLDSMLPLIQRQLQ